MVILGGWEGRFPKQIPKLLGQGVVTQGDDLSRLTLRFGFQNALLLRRWDLGASRVIAGKARGLHGYPWCHLGSRVVLGIKCGDSYMQVTLVLSPQPPRYFCLFLDHPWLCSGLTRKLEPGWVLHSHEQTRLNTYFFQYNLPHPVR